MLPLPLVVVLTVCIVGQFLFTVSKDRKLRRSQRDALALIEALSCVREERSALEEKLANERKASAEDASKLYHASGNVELLRKRLDESDNDRNELNTRLLETDANLARANDQCLTKDVEIEKLRYELQIAEFWRQKLVKMVEGLEHLEGPQNAARRFKLVEVKPIKFGPRVGKKSSTKAA